MYAIPFVIFSIGYIIIHQAVHAVGMGGDYSYSLLHLLPNTVGNYIGYLSLFLFGQNVLPFFSSLRLSLKSYSLVFVGAGGLVIAGLVYLLVKQQNKLRSVLRNNPGRFVVFTLSFIFIALLPFLGLGNMSERYGYVASVGFVMLVSYVLMWIVETFAKKKEKVIIISVVIIFTVVLFATSLISLSKEAQDWNKASNVTAYTLRYMHVLYGDIPPGSTLYFVNTPIRTGNAWVFPVGLPDGLWFIYSDDTQVVKNTGTVEEAKAEAAGSKSKSYIFEFDKDMKIKIAQ